MTTLKEQALADLKSEIDHVSITLKCCYTSTMALRRLHLEMETAFKQSLTAHSFPSPLEIGQTVNHTYTSIRSNHEFLTIKAALDYAESLPEVIDAIATIQPMIDRYAELEAAIEAERRTAALAAQALQAAEDAARKSAEEQLANDPKVKAAREALAAAQPALVEPSPDIIPVRGVIKSRPQLETV